MITPDAFDTLVRDTLHDVDAHTHQHPSLADQYIAHAREAAPIAGSSAIRHRRWIAPVLAAAAVVAVVVGVVWASSRGRTSPVPPATRPPTINAPSTTPPPTSPPTVPAPAPAVPSFSAISVSYLDAQHGWALGDGRCRTGGRTNCATILRTVDGGSHWRAIGVPAGVGSTKDEGSCGSNGTITAPCIDDIVFASPTVGYVWSYRVLYMTTNGGRTWTDLHSSRVRQVVVVDSTAVRMNTRSACSAGCSFGVFAAPVGTTKWEPVIPYSADGVGDWQLAGSSPIAYLLEQLPGSGEMTTPATQALYRSTDGSHWTRVSIGGPCGAKAVDRIKVDVVGTLTATCV